jgi:PhnB protein
MAKSQFKPEGFSTVTPYLIVRGAGKLIDFLKAAFDAEEKLRVPTDDGNIMHAEMRIADSVVELADANERYGPMPASLHVYVPDCDAVYARAIQAGGKPIQELTDQSYGERSGGVLDPCGNQWWIATLNTAR